MVNSDSASDTFKFLSEWIDQKKMKSEQSLGYRALTKL